MKLVVKGKPEIEIVGTLEIVHGVAKIEPDADEASGWSYICSGTDIDWDSQKTVERDGQRVFVDDGGNEYLESELELVEEEDDQ